MWPLYKIETGVMWIVYTPILRNGLHGNVLHTCLSALSPQLHVSQLKSPSSRAPKSSPKSSSSSCIHAGASLPLDGSGMVVRLRSGMHVGVEGHKGWQSRTSEPLLAAAGAKASISSMNSSRRSGPEQGQGQEFTNIKLLNRAKRDAAWVHCAGVVASWR